MTEPRYKTPSLSTSIESLMSLYGKVPPMNTFSTLEKQIITSKTLLQQARIYKMEGDLENLYICWFRFASYVLTEFPKHPKFSKTHPKIIELRSEAAKIIGELENLKNNLKKLYQDQEKAKSEPPKPKVEALTATSIATSPLSSSGSFSNIISLTQQLERQSFEEREAALKPAPKPLPPPSISPDSNSISSLSPSTPQTQTTGGPGFFPANPCFLIQDPVTGMFIPVNALPSADDSNPKAEESSILKPTAIDAKLDALLSPKPPLPSPTTTAPPSVTTTTTTTTTPSAPQGKPRRRNVYVEGELFARFMEIATPNTAKNIETCGILAGHLKDDVMRITHCIIPKQTGSSDTCAMTHEEEILDYCDKNDLITLGWIHTHPSHQLFLSSVDMHTHCSYQSLLDEAIAVVVAPKYVPNFGIFSLTDIGLDVIQTCPQRGFHPHEKFGLYNTCSHVKLVWGKNSFVVEDLRKKK